MASGICGHKTGGAPAVVTDSLTTFEVWVQLQGLIVGSTRWLLLYRHGLSSYGCLGGKGRQFLRNSHYSAYGSAVPAGLEKRTSDTYV